MDASVKEALRVQNARRKQVVSCWSELPVDAVLCRAVTLSWNWCRATVGCWSSSWKRLPSCSTTRSTWRVCGFARSQRSAIRVVVVRNHLTRCMQWLCETFNQASLSGRLKTAMDVLVLVCERADKFLENQALSSSGEGGSGFGRVSYVVRCFSNKSQHAP
jgi:hypothetical protein